jgi:beta-glucosidase
MSDFPSEFIWGVSTSAYQIEGAPTADGKGESIWDRFVQRPGAIRGGATGQVATDHYHRYLEDVALLPERGVGAYRLSLSWPRLLPEGRGRVAAGGLDHYQRLLDALAAAGIRPWVCLYHWDLPQALQQLGGWASRDTAYYFADYAELVAERLGDRVDTFLMLNEPNVHALLGHLAGVHAPGLTGLPDYLAAIHHLNLAVGAGVQRLRQLGAWQLGSVVNLQPLEAASESEDDQAAAALADEVYNRASLDPLLTGGYGPTVGPLLEAWLRPGDMELTQQPIDLLGLNHYTVQRVAAGPGPIGISLVGPPAGSEVTAMGWPVHPEALTRQLVELQQRYGNPPVVITENGAAFHDPPARAGRIGDARRVDYLRRYLRATSQALALGCDVRGYFAWTLVDNFEWADGYERPFGLVHLDRQSLKRTPKESYRFYQDVIAAGSVPG